MDQRKQAQDRYSIALDPARRISLSQIVLDQLLEQFRGGMLRPGDLLPPEPELMRMMNVGRSSVREAMRGLITLGLVETKPGRGTIVAEAAANPFNYIRQKGESVDNLRKWALIDLLEVRESIEGQAAQLAAVRSTKSDRDVLAQHLVAVERDIKDGRTYFRSNTEFHLSIARASHNSVLSESVRNLIGQVRDYREHFMKTHPGMPKQDIVAHAAIFAAIGDHNPKKARNEMIKHIRSFSRLVASVDPSEYASRSRTTRGG
jgi:GntR family transcriptional repressor for pyruvate dehydrogenase complex